MSDAHLLPSSSSQLERDLSLSQNPLPRTEGKVPVIRTGKRIDILDSVVPYLIEEYGLGEITPYVPDLRQALAEGIQWQRVRGTRTAIDTALGWIDFPAQIEESESQTLRWADYQLGTEPPDDHSQIDAVVGVTRLSQPIRSRLFRIYGGYDHRRFKLDDHQLSGGSWLCDHTGVYVKPEWPQLSFGREYQKAGELGDPDFHFCLSRFWPVQAWSADIFRLDIATLQEEQDAWHAINHPGIHGRLYGYESTDGLQTDQTMLPERRFCKAQIVLSDSWVLGDTNACFPAYFEEEVGDGVFTLSGEDKLSEQTLELVRYEWLERHDVVHSQSAENLVAPQVSGDVETHAANSHILLDSFILSRDYLDETAPPILLEPAIRQPIHAESARYGERVWGAFEWPAIAWDSPPAVVQTDIESFCEGQIILSEQGELGDTNACFPTMYEEEQGDGVLHLSEDDLSETVLKLVQVEVLKRHDEVYAGSASYDFQPTATGDIATSAAYHISVVDTFILDRDQLDEAQIPVTLEPAIRQPLRTGEFNEPYGTVESSRELGRTIAATWPVVSSHEQTVATERTHSAAHAVATSQVGVIAPNYTVSSTNTTTNQQQSGPGVETTIFSTFAYQGLTADGSGEFRYAATSVYNTPTSHQGIELPLRMEASSYPTSGQVWTSAYWPTTPWSTTQVIVGSTHATT